MNWIALKMLTGNRGKYLGIILGIAFATLLIAQQASIFCGLMLQTSGQIRDIQGADAWVMDSNVQFSDDVKPLSDSDLYRVRGVPGVAWAVPLYKGLTRSRLEDGNFQQTILIGLDDATLVGAPPNMILGSVFDLRKPDAVIMDVEGYKLLWPHEEPRIGKRFEMNDKEAEIVGICRASRTFQTFPVVYTRYSQALDFVPPERKVLSFVLADATKGADVEEVCRRIEKQTGLRAVTGPQFEWITMMYFMRKTGIPFNFGITVALGFIVGTAIAAQTFLPVHNRKHQAVWRAQGDGGGELRPDGHDHVAGTFGELHWFRAGDRRRRVVRPALDRGRLAAGVLHAVGSVRRRRVGRGSDQRVVESLEYAAGDGGRTGRGFPRIARWRCSKTIRSFPVGT